LPDPEAIKRKQDIGESFSDPTGISAFLETQAALVNDELSLMSVMALSVQAVRKATPSDGVAVGLVEDGCIAYQCASGMVESWAGLQRPLEESFAIRCIQTGSVVQSAGPESDRPPSDARPTLRSILVAPLQSKHRVVGVLQAFSCKPDAFTERDVQLLRLFAGLIAARLQVAVQFEAGAQEALRNSEEQYRLLFQEAMHGMYRSTAEGRFLDANKALVRMLGYDSREEVLALDLNKDIYAYPEERTALLERCQRGESTKGEVVWKRRDGSRIVVLLSGHPLKRRGRPVVEFEAIAEDVTERKNLEEQLRQSQRVEALGQLAGGIAHDFNNIVNIITGYCELLAREYADNASLQRKIKEIYAAAQRAISLTRPLLAVNGKEPPEPRLLNLNLTIWETHKVLRRLIPATIDLVPVLGADLGRVKADAGQIQQVLVNLVVNARDAIPGSGKIVIQTANMDVDGNVVNGGPPRGDYVRLSVSDNGCGMDEETRSRVFEPFFTTKEVGHGTGLGLATVMGIVKQSGGHIQVESIPEEGTAFHIFFPREGTSTGRTVGGEIPSAALAGTETILIADDELAIRKIVSTCLKKLGYSVLTAKDGDEVVKVCQEYERPIHLLLADVIMPKTNGLQAWKSIRDTRPEMRVLFMSGYTADVLGPSQVLISDFEIMEKPFAIEDLVHRVRDILNRGPERFFMV